MRFRAVVAAADKSDHLPAQRYTQVPERPARRQQFVFVAVFHAHQVNAIGHAVGRRAIRRLDHDALPIRQPLQFLDSPRRLSECALFVFGQIHDAQARILLISIHHARVVFVLFLFFLHFGFWVRGKIPDGLAIRRPREHFHSRFAFGYRGCLSSLHPQDIDLLLLAAI
jgi:hypothetical protein